MASCAAHRLTGLLGLWVGAALLGGCSRGVTSTSEPRAAELTQSPKRSQSETNEQAAKPPPAAEGLCAEICSRTTALKCGPLDNCLRGCAEMRSSNKCSAELDGFLRCSAAQSVEHWECDAETGAAGLRDEYCTAEQGAVAACLERAS
jgi:hypothetical protein